MLYGVDVSNFQGNYNWTSEGFGFAKATEGAFFKDAYFKHNWDSMWKKGILRGAYHFAHPGTSAKAQADYFVSYVKAHGLTRNDVLALDLEASDGKSASQVNSWAVAFINEVKALTGKNVWVYTMGSWAGSAYTASLRNQPLWIANPNNNAGSSSSFGWHNWTCHQYSWQPIDKDAFNGTATTWAALANVGGAPQAPKPAPAPDPAPVDDEEDDMLHGQLTIEVPIDQIPFPMGSFRQIMAWRNRSGDSAPSSVRFYAHGYKSGVKQEDHALTGDQPVHFVLPDDCNAVEIALLPGAASPVGWTLAKE